MASTAAFEIKGTVTGLPQGSESVSITITNSTSVGVTEITTLSSAAASANTFTPPTHSRLMLIQPPSTNTDAIHLAGSTSETVGAVLSSTGASLLTITTGTTYYLYSTVAAGIPDVRVSFW